MESECKPFQIRQDGPSISIVPAKGRQLTAAILSDIHFPFEDPEALRLAIEIIGAVTPDLVILNGDIVDFFGVSRYPTPPQRRVNFAKELESSRERLHGLLREYHTAQWIYIEGNHEYRLRQYLYRKAQELADLEALSIPNLLALPGHVTYLAHVEEPQSREDFAAPQIRLGKLFILHGDTVRTNGATINVARTVFLRLLKPVLIGHWHRVQSYTQTDYEGVTSGAWVTGCLCRPRPHYDTGRIWGQGIAVIAVENGFFEVELVPFIAKDRYLQAIFRGKRYRVRIS